MSRTDPPKILERVLFFVLSPAHQETVSGDLLEEFHERRSLGASQLSATVWYARQVLSFLPHSFSAMLDRSPALALLCGFTATCGVWLGAMDLRLKHPGYAGREVIAGIIVFQALLTLGALSLGRVPLLRTLAAIGCFAIFWLAVKALRATLSGAHMEGYVLLIALALIIQGILTLYRFAADRRAQRAGRI